jgi:hypothetical protein
MSLQGAPVTAALPAVNQAFEPEWVRRGSPATQKAYASALAFEQTLVEQLSTALTATSGLGGASSPEGEGSQEDASGSEGDGASAFGAGNSALSSMLPQSLSAGVMDAGGLGMAAQMTRELEGAGAAAPTQEQASGGTAPGASSGAGSSGAIGATTGTTGGAGA